MVYLQNMAILSKKNEVLLNHWIRYAKYIYSKPSKKYIPSVQVTAILEMNAPLKSASWFSMVFQILPIYCPLVFPFKQK